MISLWRIAVLFALILASMGLWLRPPVKVTHVDCVEMWTRMEKMQDTAEAKLLAVMLQKLERALTPIERMRRIKIRDLNRQIAPLEVRMTALQQNLGRQIAVLEKAAKDEETRNYTADEARAFLRDHKE